MKQFDAFESIKIFLFTLIIVSLNPSHGKVYSIWILLMARCTQYESFSWQGVLNMNPSHDKVYSIWILLMARCTQYESFSWQGVLNMNPSHGKVYSIWILLMTRCTQYESFSWQGVLNTTLCDKVSQQVKCFLLVLGFPPPIKLTAMI
jgi:hypothetical protein